MISTRLVVSILGLGVGGLLVLGLAGGQDGRFGGPERRDWGGKGFPDKANPEEKAILRAAERASRRVETDRDKWLEELTKVFRDRVSPGLSDADFGQWFDLLAGGEPEWYRDAAPKPTRELFDKVAERLGLGKVPSIRRDEFLAYARRNLPPGSSPPWNDPLSGADKVFRELDQDRSGFLEPPEWTDRLREAAPRVDADRDGRISPTEYRAYFEGRVVVTLQRGPEPPRPSGPRPAAGPPPAAERREVATRFGHLPAGLPSWFVELDISRDGQISLYEWRLAGRPVPEFVAMDLNGDGLLTPDEYLRGVELRRAEEEALLRMEGIEPPPKSSPTSGKMGNR